MKRKIFLYGIMISAISVIACGLLTGFLIHQMSLDALKNHLKDSLCQLSATVSVNGDTQQVVDATTDALKKNMTGYDIRFTVMDENGDVLADSHYSADAMEIHSDRPEFLEAKTQTFGTAYRYSDTLRKRMLYVATLSEDSTIILRAAAPVEDINAMLWRIFYICLIGLAGGVLISLLISIIRSPSLARPAKALAEACHRISDGSYDQRITLNTKTEYDAVAEDFNRMADKLSRTISKLHNRNSQLDMILSSMNGGLVAVDEKQSIIFMNAIAAELFDIPSDSEQGKPLYQIIENANARQLVTQCLKHGEGQQSEVTLPTTPPSIYRMATTPITEDGTAKGCILTMVDVTRIRQLEIMRSQFVSNVTHELRTPLTSIKGYVETLRNGAITNADLADRFLEIIDIEAERLHNLIGDLLDLADIESGVDGDIIDCDLQGGVDQCIELLSMAAKEKGVSIHTDIDGGLTVQGNAHRLQQLFINLIDNGIKYNVENGRIDIIAYQASGKVVIKVQDTGIGIGDQHLSRIFERFYRVDKGRSRQMGGTGLGLSIVKHLVGLYSGNIVIDSEEGRGTTFTIELPQ